MKSRIVAMLVAISLLGCSSTPRTPSPPPAEGQRSAASSPAGGAENAPQTPQTTENALEPAAPPGGHALEIAKGLGRALLTVVTLVVIAGFLVLMVVH